MTSNTLKEIDHFELLVKNAIDFMQKSLKDLDLGDEYLKYSVINFYTSVELFLKARLLKEHWSLIVDKDADKNKFDAGDFVSISFSKLRICFDKILNKPLQDAVIKKIDIIGKHRNKMVHFYHSSYQKNKDELISDQMAAWYDINNLIKGEWKEYFKDYMLEIERIDTDLRRNYLPYLERHYTYVYEKRKDQISEMKKREETIIVCKVCKKKAVYITEKILHKENSVILKKQKCLVCSDYSPIVEIPCPNCEKKLEISPYLGEGYCCPNCDKIATRKYIKKNICFNGNYYKEGDTDIGCSNCEDYDSVVPISNNLYFCINCFEIHNFIKRCEYCGHYSTDVPEISEYYGCDFCSGYL